jgi:hypothetical protein
VEYRREGGVRILLALQPKDPHSLPAHARGPHGAIRACRGSVGHRQPCIGRDRTKTRSMK